METTELTIRDLRRRWNRNLMALACLLAAVIPNALGLWALHGEVTDPSKAGQWLMVMLTSILYGSAACWWPAGRLGPAANLSRRLCRPTTDQQGGFHSKAQHRVAKKRCHGLDGRSRLLSDLDPRRDAMLMNRHDQ